MAGVLRYVWRNRRIPQDEVDKALDKYCTIPLGSDPNHFRVKASSFNQIRNALACYEDPVIKAQWTRRPRIYTILRNIGRLDAMHDFVEKEYLDDMLPFPEEELPAALGDSRKDFVKIQAYCLTEAVELEKGEEGRHIQFNYDADLHFIRIAELGSGGFGYVDKVWSRLSHKKFARKKFLRSFGPQQTQQRYIWFEREISALKRLSHRHLVKIQGTYADPRCFAFLMQPVADCDLLYYLLRMKTDNLANLRTFFGCLANAVTYLHRVKVHHMDIKLQNVLVKHHKVYLTDFGAAHDWSQMERSTTWASIARTHAYWPPEQIGYSNAPKNYSIDMWSLGVVFLEMVTVLRGAKIRELHRYFETHGSGHIFVSENSIAANNWLEKLRNRDGPEYDNSPLMWVKDLLARDPKSRPYAKQIFEIILNAQGFCGPCCAISEYGQDWPGSAFGDIEDEGLDTGSAAEFEDAEEEPDVKEHDQEPTTMAPQKRTTIRTWLDRTEVAIVEQRRRTSASNELPFDIEDDEGSDHASQKILVPEDMHDAIPDRLRRISLFQEMADDYFPIEEREETAATDLSFDVESDNSDLHEHEAPPHVSPGPLHAETVLTSPIRAQLEMIEEEKDSEIGFDAAVVDTNANEHLELNKCATIAETSTKIDDDTAETASQASDYVEAQEVADTTVADTPVPPLAKIEIAKSRSWPVNLLFQGGSKPNIVSSNPKPDHRYDDTKRSLRTKGQPLTRDNLLQLEGKVYGSRSAQTRESLQHEGKVSRSRRRKIMFGTRVRPKEYMRQICEKETEVATTVMSERSQKIIKGLSLTVMADKHSPILEGYVAAGKTAVVRALLKAGCNPGTKEHPKLGPLYKAVMGRSLRHNKCAEALLKAGADVNMRTFKTRRTMLHLAIEHLPFPGYRGLIWTLLHYGANPNLKDRNGDYPLLNILYGGYEPLEEHRRQALALILEQSQYLPNINVEPPGTLNMPLHLAVRRKDPWAVGMLLEKGAIIDAKNGAGQTPLGLAASTWKSRMTNEHKEVVRLLLEARADPNSMLSAPKCPILNFAIRFNHTDLVEVLVEYGADPYKEDESGQNAYKCCEQFSSSDEAAHEIKFLLDQRNNLDWSSDG